MLDKLEVASLGVGVNFLHVYAATTHVDNAFHEDSFGSGYSCTVKGLVWVLVKPNGGYLELRTGHISSLIWVAPNSALILLPGVACEGYTDQFHAHHGCPLEPVDFADPNGVVLPVPPAGMTSIQCIYSNIMGTWFLGWPSPT